MKSKTWLKYFFAAVASVFIVIASYNYFFDEFQLFNSGRSFLFTKINYRFTLIGEIMKGDYDSLIIGSSRVGSLQATTANRYVRGAKFYTMPFPEGVPYDYYHHIKYILDSGIQIKHVCIGFDDFSFTIHPQSHLKSLSTYPYPPAIGKSLYAFMLKALIRKPNLIVARNYIKYRKNTSRKVAKIQKDIIVKEYLDYYKTHRKEIFSKSYPQISPFFDYSDESIDEIKKLLALCRENGIEFSVFINPVYKNNYLDSKLDLFFRFKKNLASITPYYDFSGLNSINRNDVNYTEPIHYKVYIGDMMLARIYGTPEEQKNCPEDFGVYVTKETIVDHINAQKKEIELFCRGRNN